MVPWTTALLMQVPAAAATSLSAPDARRGAAAVGAQTSDAPAVRDAEAANAGSPSFALGASVQAWRNAATAVTYVTTHVTGDGGDAEVRAEACADERIAFNRLEQRRQALGVDPAPAVAAAGQPASVARDWTVRMSKPPAACP